MTKQAISPLRRRMIEDMEIRGFSPQTQGSYLRVVRDFAVFVGGSPDKTGAEELRLYQHHLRSSGMSATSINAAVSALRFFFAVTLGRGDAPSRGSPWVFNITPIPGRCARIQLVCPIPYSATRERLGVEVADHVVDPFVRTFHFHGAQQMSMKYFDALAALFLGTDNFKPSGFTGFMETLPRALAERLDVRLASPVSVVQPSPHGDGAEVDGESFDVAVLAVQAPNALAMLAPPSRDQLTVLSATTYAPTLSVAFRCPLSVAEDFEGIWIPYHESLLISGCSNETCKGASSATECVFTFAMHAEAASALLERSDEEVFETVASEWSRLFPRYRGALRGLNIKRWPLAMPIYGPGHVERVRQFWSRGQGDGRVYLCGDYLNHPWVEGSIRCGEKVATMIAERDSAAL